MAQDDPTHFGNGSHGLLGRLWSGGLLPSNQRPQLNSCTFLIQFLISSSLPKRKSKGGDRIKEKTNWPERESRGKNGKNDLPVMYFIANASRAVSS